MLSGSNHPEEEKLARRAKQNQVNGCFVIYFV